MVFKYHRYRKSRATTIAPITASTAAKTSHALAAYESFLTTPLDRLLDGGDGRARALALFRNVAETVPAYGAFMREHGIDPASVRTPDDFSQLPLTTKDGYLRRHGLPELCRDGRLEDCDIVAVSSGSTGEPTVWPRALAHELAVATRFEQVFHDSFQADRRRTLAVVCFALGTWVGGMYTAACCRHLAAKGYPIVVVTPGNNRDEILRVVEELGPVFEQVVLLGYPPFVKDVVDTGRARGVEWSRYAVKTVLAGEVFSEEWRTLVGTRTGSTHPCHDSASLYGTADAGVLGCETPLTVAIRRFLAGAPEAASELFGDARLPTLVQYDPASRFFETHDGTLLFTGDNGVPLVRYHIADEGGLVPHDELLAFVRGRGFDPLSELGGARGVRPLPFVYVFGRSHFTVSYFGANVYPENVTVGLEQAPVADWVTGKFVLEAREDEDRDRRLALVVELAPGVEANDEKARTIADSVVTQLVRLNSEFAHYVPAERRTPQVELKPAGDPEWFPVGVKHRYTRH
jgi:phenylacetate-coenzyme A ligase PaaK-like adenylate-forming protein